MNVRRATPADEAALRALWEEFELEVPEPPGFQPQGWAEEWAALQRDMIDGGVYLAEHDGAPVGLLHAAAAEVDRWHIELVYVRPGARQRGVASDLLRAFTRDARQRGARYVSLEVLAGNHAAQAVWERLGFEPVGLLLGQPADGLERRLRGESSTPMTPGAGLPYSGASG